MNRVSQVDLPPSGEDDLPGGRRSPGESDCEGPKADRASPTVKLTVVVIRLDDLFRDGLVIDCIKVDVEGIDTWVLMGGERPFKNGLIRSVIYEQLKPRRS